MDPQEQQNNQFGVLKLQSPPPLVDYPAESGFSFANPVYEPNVRKLHHVVYLEQLNYKLQENPKVDKILQNESYILTHLLK
jgi:hypothetical protein